MDQGAMGLGMLGQRQVTPRWANDTVCLHAGSRQESGQGQLRAPPPRRKSEGGWRKEETVKKSRVAHVTIHDGS